MLPTPLFLWPAIPVNLGKNPVDSLFSFLYLQVKGHNLMSVLLAPGLWFCLQLHLQHYTTGKWSQQQISSACDLCNMPQTYPETSSSEKCYYSIAWFHKILSHGWHPPDNKRVGFGIQSSSCLGSWIPGYRLKLTIGVNDYLSNLGLGYTKMQHFRFSCLLLLTSIHLNSDVISGLRCFVPAFSK